MGVFSGKKLLCLKSPVQIAVTLEVDWLGTGNYFGPIPKQQDLPRKKQIITLNLKRCYLILTLIERFSGDFKMRGRNDDIWIELSRKLIGEELFLNETAASCNIRVNLIVASLVGAEEMFVFGFPVDPEARLRSRPSSENTQRRSGANRQEPEGPAKVWHLLARLEIHTPNPECVLKPAAADGCGVTGGGAESVTTSRSSVSLVSPGRTPGSELKITLQVTEGDVKKGLTLG